MHVSRLTALPVAILVAAGLTACGGEPAAAPSPSPTKAVVAESPTPTPDADRRGAHRRELRGARDHR